MFRASLGLPLRGSLFCAPELGKCVFLVEGVCRELKVSYRLSNLNLESEIKKTKHLTLPRSMRVWEPHIESLMRL